MNNYSYFYNFHCDIYWITTVCQSNVSQDTSLKNFYSEDLTEEYLMKRQNTSNDKRNQSRSWSTWRLIAERNFHPTPKATRAEATVRNPVRARTRKNVTQKQFSLWYWGKIQKQIGLLFSSSYFLCVPGFSQGPKLDGK